MAKTKVSKKLQPRNTNSNHVAWHVEGVETLTEADDFEYTWDLHGINHALGDTYVFVPSTITRVINMASDDALVDGHTFATGTWNLLDAGTGIAVNDQTSINISGDNVIVEMRD